MWQLSTPVDDLSIDFAKVHQFRHDEASQAACYGGEDQAVNLALPMEIRKSTLEY